MINEISGAGVNCVLSSVANIIARYDPSVDEAAMLFSEDGFNLEYRIDGMAGLRNIVLKSTIEYIAQSFLANRGIRTRYSYADLNGDTDDLTALIRELTVSGPILAAMESTRLKYSPVFAANARREHAIVIYGLSGERIHFSDYFIPTCPVSACHGEMEPEAFMEAWSGTKYKYIDIDWEKAQNVEFDITEDKLRDSVGRNLGRFLSGSAEGRDISGLYGFSSDIGLLPEMFTAEDIRRNMDHLCFSIQFSGIMSGLTLLKNALLRLTAGSRSGVFCDRACQVDGLLERWRKVTLMLGKASFRISTAYFESIGSYAIETVRMQESLLKSILNEYYPHTSL